MIASRLPTKTKIKLAKVVLPRDNRLLERIAVAAELAPGTEKDSKARVLFDMSLLLLCDLLEGLPEN